MAFDPFGDRQIRGYPRNNLATNDPELVRRLESQAFSANVLPALAALKAAPTVGYQELLDKHRQIFSSVYPSAGQDRAALAPGIAIAKEGLSDLFAHPADGRLAAECGLAMGFDPTKTRAYPGEVFGALA